MGLQDLPLKLRVVLRLQRDHGSPPGWTGGLLPPDGSLCLTPGAGESPPGPPSPSRACPQGGPHARATEEEAAAVRRWDGKASHRNLRLEKHFIKGEPYLKMEWAGQFTLLHWYLTLGPGGVTRGRTHDRAAWLGALRPATALTRQPLLGGGGGAEEPLLPTFEHRQGRGSGVRRGRGSSSPNPRPSGYKTGMQI